MKQILYSGIVVLLLFVIVGFTNAGNYSVINKSGVNVTGISISPAGMNFQNAVTFSRSINTDQIISIDFESDSENCLYDIKYSDSNGKSYVMSGIDLCESNEIILERVITDEAPAIQLK
ncbi:MAG TPA: hypothetical protein VK004_02965 [Ignavibacteria bacterium]|nr:hypothetical protein [Ignavibacteria bacterium]